MIEIIPHTIGSYIFPMKCGFGIIYGANSGFGFAIEPKPN
jgi:hypothetical protein